MPSIGENGLGWRAFFAQIAEETRSDARVAGEGPRVTVDEAVLRASPL